MKLLLALSFAPASSYIGNRHTHMHSHTLTQLQYASYCTWVPMYQSTCLNLVTCNAFYLPQQLQKQKMLNLLIEHDAIFCFTLTSIESLPSLLGLPHVFEPVDKGLYYASLQFEGKTS